MAKQSSDLYQRLGGHREEQQDQQNAIKSPMLTAPGANKVATPPINRRHRINETPKPTAKSSPKAKTFTDRASKHPATNATIIYGLAVEISCQPRPLNLFALSYLRITYSPKGHENSVAGRSPLRIIHSTPAHLDSQ